MKSLKPFLPALVLAVVYLLAFGADHQYKKLPIATPSPVSTESPVGLTTSDQAYYEREDAFNLGVLDPDTGSYLETPEAVQLNAQFLSREPIDDGSGLSRESLDFADTASGKRISFVLDTAISTHIALDSQKPYTIAYQKITGSPSLDGLLIMTNQDLVFLGVTDIGLGNTITVQALSPLQVGQSRLLEDHVKVGQGCWSKKTNREIQFAQGENSAWLHQGQTETLGAYTVLVLVAEDTEYTGTCTDAGEAQVSYIIYP